ncbi:MAG TPA: tannase/feruloyl esterase family alpha/beta hydrolase [Vicinamibacterales bacterium]|jgi:feruloyl esterase|nr:tannase/feruloyl esterase family alpha/beta hydrolase [Vicinamibacterales bacterium]
MHARSVTFATLLLALIVARAALAQSVTRCENLTQLSLPATSVTAARMVPTGSFDPATDRAATDRVAQRQPFLKLPAFCLVQLTARPSNDSEIDIEVWLPESRWNGRFQAVGEGGLAGAIPHALMASALAEGYATAGTDTGHAGNNADFMPGHPEKLIDFAYRSTHELALAGKAVIRAFYGSPPRWSYYNACSGGGRHGLTSAQRYPDDFQGIVAGAASWNQARLDAARIGINLTVNRTPASRIPASKYPMIHDAVMKVCDLDDGVKDGVLENPTKCRFDYATLLCKGPDGPSCLTAPQVESAVVLTSPFTDPTSGKVLLDAHLWPGSELQWGTLGGPEPLVNSLSRVRNFHLKDPRWDFRLSNIAADVERAVTKDGGLLASDEFNLTPFFDRGGKLLMWHGWSDPQVPAENSVIYFRNVLKAVGSGADQSIALFMLPGVLHCGGGPGPDTFDGMAAISNWVENGQKPARIVASRVTAGKIDRTRPLCPIGQVAKYDGVGSTDAASSFTCAAEAPPDAGR